MSDPTDKATAAGLPQSEPDQDRGRPQDASAQPAPRWRRHRWTLIAGVVAAAAVLFFAGMAVGTTIRGDDQGRFDRYGGWFGHGGWRDGDDGMRPPGMGRGGQGMPRMGQGRRQGDDWGGGRGGRSREGVRGGRGEYRRPGCPGCPWQQGAPNVTPSPTSSPQSYSQ